MKSVVLKSLAAVAVASAAVVAVAQSSPAAALQQAFAAAPGVTNQQKVASLLASDAVKSMDPAAVIAFVLSVDASEATVQALAQLYANNQAALVTLTQAALAAGLPLASVQSAVVVGSALAVPTAAGPTGGAGVGFGGGTPGSGGFAPFTVNAGGGSGNGATNPASPS